MTETLPVSPAGATTADMEGWTMVRSGEYGNGQQYDVMQSPDGRREKMVEKTGVSESEPDLGGSFGQESPANGPPTPENIPAPLIPEQQAIQAHRDQWAENNPGQSIRAPEGLTSGPEDLARVEAEAENYGFDTFGRKNIEDSYNHIQQLGADRESSLKQKYAAEGYTAAAFDQLIKAKRTEAMAEARRDLAESSLPYPPNAKKREIKKIDKRRDQLLGMLGKTPDEFAVLQADWGAYEDITHTAEIDKLNNSALEDDKSLKATEERARLTAEIAALDEKNGGVLEYMGQFQLEGDAGTAQAVKSYKERVSRHKGDEDLLDADRLQGQQDFEARLSEIIVAGDPSLSAEDVRRRVGEASPRFETWLEAIAESDGDPLADLAEYKQKQNAHELWDKRRRQAVEYLGPMVLLRSVQNMLSRNPETAEEPKINPGETIKVLLDPRKIGEKNGGHALLHSDELSQSDINVYGAGIMGQLELARTYSRHQGNVMKAALLLNGLAAGVSHDMSAAWDRLPDEDKRKEFKKKMFGKAAVGSLFARRLAAKAAQKTKSAAVYAGRQVYVGQDSEI